MSKRKPSPPERTGEEEPRGFAKAIESLGDVRPLDRENVTATPPPPSRPRDEGSQSSSLTQEPSTDDTLSRASIVQASRSEMRRLRAGRIRPQQTIDLHGHRRDQARRRLANAIARARTGGLRCVLVVHGKGTRSAGGEAVLRDALGEWLAEPPLRAQVIGACLAQPRDGGHGASYLLLRAPGEKKPAK